jgi:subtilisin-like proprotein convertase family protein
VSRTAIISASLAAALCAACASDDNVVTTTTAPPAALDVIGLSERPASLVVVDHADGAARRRFERGLERLGGAVIASLPPRLVIAQIPDGADAALADLGMLDRFDTAVDETVLQGATADEARFINVYSNRWQVAPHAMKIVAHAADPMPGEAFERSPSAAPEGDQPPFDPEDQVSVPYASGTVVVSIVLPESNGAIDPSTEDWNEDRIREIYLKVQAALDQIASSEPNADLRFVLHYEGLVDSDYEFGQRAQWGDWVNESLATAHVLSRILGHEVDPTNPWPAAMEYQLALRNQYEADAAFFVLVAANHNWTAGLRAHAYINGPWTTLESNNGADVFMHEFGHIFGALDEYCPDACVPPTALHGYLGIVNANAEFREGDPWNGGINNGRGEGAPSLMQYNQMGAVNGYTRGAWGWLDGDGDGVIDVRDTAPRSLLAADTIDQTVRISGLVVDRPQTALWRTPYSINRIVGLEIELERNGVVEDVIDVALPGATRGRQAVDVELPPLPAGVWTLRVRAENDAGNKEAVPQVLIATVSGTQNTPPIAHLDLPALRALSSSASYPVHAGALDLDGDAAEVRVDLGADGSFETGWAAAHDLDVTPDAGVYAILVEARDAAGATATRTVESLVFAGNAPPEVTLGNVPSLVHGALLADVAMTATAIDPEGATPDFSWLATLATDDARFDAATGWGAGAETSFGLPTPQRLATTRVDLSVGNPDLTRGRIGDLIALSPTTVAVAGGITGVWFVDISNLSAPALLSHVDLETTANQLYRDGDLLYVLGTMLTVVDISDLSAPVEIEQLFATNGTRTARWEETLPIVESEQWGASHFLFVEEGERITEAKVIVTVDHPRIGQLKITLHPPKHLGLGAIVLRDHHPGANGLRTFTFTAQNVPALAGLEGAFAAEGWMIEVVDDVIDGQAGSLLATELRFKTRSRAARVIPQAARFAGQLWTGDLVIAGAGVEALSTAFPFWIHSQGRITGTGTVDAVMVGDVVVAAMPLESKGVVNPVLKGLVAVDFTVPFWPQIVRIEDDLGVAPSELARVGSRLYLRAWPMCDPENPVAGEDCEVRSDITLIIDPEAFAAGADSWELGRTDLRIDRRAFGDDETLWTVGNEGYVQRYDVSDLGKIEVIAAYPQSWTSAIIPLTDSGDVLLFGFSTEVQVGNLADVISTLSRTYRLAVESRDADGAIGRAYRTVHVIPYDHAPAITDVVQDGQDPMLFRVFAADPDAGQIWDPNLLVRADWDGDGVFDSDWTFFGNQPGQWGELYGAYPGPGTYATVFEVRDGYWASSRMVRNVTVE